MKSCNNCAYSGGGAYTVCMREEPEIVAYNLEKISPSGNATFFSTMSTTMRKLPESDEERQKIAKRCMHYKRAK
jgi:hypothetical protein